MMIIINSSKNIRLTFICLSRNLIRSVLNRLLHQTAVLDDCAKTGACKKNETSKWESVVGLEIHAQINAKSKLFSSSATVFGAPTNTEVSYLDAAFPGCLPVLNHYCIKAGVLTALALNCTVHKISMFDRKHYFYPDLPAGYQITQQFYPLASNGHVSFIVPASNKDDSSYECTAYLKQLQLEQDSGRSFHVQKGRSLVDLNRAGIGLMELVFEPNLQNGAEASALVKELALIFKRLGTCSCEMEEGALRVDANISVNLVGQPFGVRTEVKNINSFRYIAKAIDYEIDRQIKVLEDGGYISNETRSYDYDTKKTIFMRDKETLQDYRYMPEPNLPPIKLCDDSDADLYQNTLLVNIDTLRKQLPLLPAAERTELISTYHVPYKIADKLVDIDGLRSTFELIASTVDDFKFIFEFLINNVQHQLNVRKLTFTNCPVAGEQLAEIVQLITSKTISEATASDILEMLFNGDLRSAKEIVEKYNWYLIHEEAELEPLCRKAMAARPKMAQKYRRSQKRRYMTSLLVELNEICNNRASIRDAERVFTKLICGPDRASDEKTVNKVDKDNVKHDEDL